MIEFDEARCKSCGICVEFCPKKCLRITDKINEKGHKIAGIVDQSRCVSCGICYTVCPDVAIIVS
jgi:2-oxoglutarate ferredoxin oxidoreductase subunit delta